MDLYCEISFYFVRLVPFFTPFILFAFIWFACPKGTRERKTSFYTSKLWYQWGLKRGKTTNFILKLHILVLLFFFLILHFFAAAAFGLLFVEFDGVYKNDEDRRSLIREDKFWPCFYFSSLNQTTLGGGQLIPKDLGKVFVSIQSIGSLLLNSIMFGLIVFRIINRKPAIIFPKKLSCDCDYFQGLTVQIWNRDSDSYYDIKISISVTRRVNTIRDERTYQSYLILLDHDTPDLFRPGMVVYGWTLRENPHNRDEKRYAKTVGSFDRPHVGTYWIHSFDITHLKKNDRIEIVFVATSVNKGTHIVATRSYTCKQIICGSYRNIRPFERGDDVGPKKYSNFWKFNKSNRKCDDCDKRDFCVVYAGSI